MLHVFRSLRRTIGPALRDLLPLIAVVLFFELAIIRRPFPDPGSVLLGLLFVALGLALFVRGLDIALFPLGEAMAATFARKGSLVALLAFALALGFGTTFAGPGLIALTRQAADGAAFAGLIGNDEASLARHALGLRLSVAVATGLGLLIGILRILFGWPVPALVLVHYLAIAVLSAAAPRETVALAYDCGAAATSTITVPFVTALGVGLASSIRGRNPAVDGFGLIAFASLMPVVCVLAFSMIVR